MTENQYTEVGKILKAHGLKGELKVSLEAFFLPICEKQKPVLFLLQNGSHLPYFFLRLKQQVGFQILVLEDVNDRNQATQLTGLKIYCDSKLVPQSPLPRDPADLKVFIGYQILDVNSNTKAEVIDVQEVKGQILATVQLPENRETFLPLHPDLILDIEHDKGLITTSLPEGLLDL